MTRVRPRQEAGTHGLDAAEQDDSMGTKETRLQRGRRRGRDLTRGAVTQLRDARLAAGISQAALAEQLGLTQAAISMLEGHKVDELSLVRVSEIAAILGLEPSLTLHPVGPPIRDKGHEALITRFRKCVAPTWSVTREAPFPGVGDPALVGRAAAIAG